MNISVECNTDHFILSHLIRRSGAAGIKILHQGGKTGVLYRLKRSRGESGMIDEDPTSHPHPLLGEYHQIDGNRYFKTFERMDDEMCRLVMVSPFLEEVIVQIRLDEGFDVPEPDIGTDPLYLHSLNPYRSIDYQKYLENIMDRSRSFGSMLEMFGII